MDDPIRDAELQLDREYLDFPFYQYSDDIAIPYLLKAYGDIERELSVEEFMHSEFYSRRVLFNLIQGISQCLRWVFKHRSEHKNQPSCDLEELNTKTMDFVRWGMEYIMLAQQYVAYSRNLLTCEVDEQKRWIKFVPPSHEGCFFLMQQHFAADQEIQDNFDLFPHKLFEKEYNLWAREIDLNQPPIAAQMDWERARDSALFPEMKEVARKNIFPEVRGETDLGCYTLSDYRQFYSLLFINFHFIRNLEAHIDKTMGPENPFGSNPISLPHSEMIHFLSKTTGLSDHKTTAILKDLTFDGTHFHTSIFIQPFVMSHSNTVHILPNLFAYIEPERTLAGALTKNPRKKIYDRLINQIEQTNVNELECLIKQQSCFEVLKEKTFVTKVERIKPDLVIIDHQHKTVLVCDYKHFIVPLSASEVDYRLREMKKGIDQLNRYLRCFQSNSHLLNACYKQEMEDYQFFGLLLFHKPMPIPYEKPDDISICYFEAFRNAVLTESTIVGLLSQLENINPGGLQAKDFVFEDIETKSGEWTFVRKIYASGISR